MKHQENSEEEQVIQNREKRGTFRGDHNFISACRFYKEGKEVEI